MKRHYDWEYMRDLLKKTLNIKEKLSKVSIWANLIDAISKRKWRRFYRYL